MIADILQTLFARRELDEASLRAVLTDIMAGTCGEAEAAALLVGLRMKGESAGEIATAAAVLREHMVPCDVDRAGRDDVLDTCGTGGDGAGTFNISTATALVVAGTGVPVVKHGNRSVSSRSGSADVLAALGVKIDGDAAYARRCLDEAGFAFCFAPVFHPALKHVAALRRRLGVPTIFNCLGPLVNPAGARRQLLGVGRRELLDLMAGALAKLGTTYAIVVHSRDGLDEVSLAAPTEVRVVENDTVREAVWSPEDFGLGTAAPGTLAVEDAAGSADVIRRVLGGEATPATPIVLANAAAGLVAAGRVTKLREGVELAREAVRSGKAAAVLERLRKLGQG
jgi:anthranilate phosphoribosyltransferase